MAGLRRIVFSLKLRKEPDDDDLAKVRRQSALKRSNAILRKKKVQPIILGNNNVSPNNLHEDQREPPDDVENVAPYGDYHLGRLRSAQNFDDEIRANSRLRVAQDIPYAPKHQASMENVFDQDLSLRRGEREKAKARQSVPALKPTRSGNGSGSLRRRHRLRVIHEERAQKFHRSSSSAVFLSPPLIDHLAFDQPRPIADDPDSEQSFQKHPVLPPIGDVFAPLFIRGNLTHERQGSWIHRKRGNRQIFERVSQSVGYSRDVSDQHPSANSSIEETAFARLQRIAADVRSLKTKNMQGRTSNSDQHQPATKQWIREQEDSNGVRLPPLDGHSDAQVQPPAPVNPKTVTEMYGEEGQQAILLAAGQLSDEELDGVPRRPRSVLQQHRDCIVCGDSKAVLEFPAHSPSAACDHTPQTCSDCLESWMASEVDTKGTEGIICPECPVILTYADVQRAASATTFATYENLTIRAALGALADFAWCLSPTCTSGQENLANANYMDCAACGYKQCLSHRTPWHVEESCEEYDYRTSGQKTRDEERQTEQMLDTMSKKCPNPDGCGWRIEKVSGCDHMTCKRCRFEFCWVCGASHQEIRRVGNAAHKSSCGYHSRNLDVTWPFNAH